MNVNWQTENVVIRDNPKIRIVVGTFPGRKRIMLYMYDYATNNHTTLASFNSEESALLFVNSMAGNR